MTSKAYANVAKLREFVHVEEPRFGARGDGVTDDTVAIQAAIDYASPLGMVTRFSEKSYKVTTLSMRNLTKLVGTRISAGRGNDQLPGTRLVGTAGFNTIEFSPSPGLTYFNQVVSWLRTEQGLNGLAMIHSNAGNYQLPTAVLVKGCNLDGTNAGILLEGPKSELFFEECQIHGNSYGIDAYSDSGVHGTGAFDGFAFRNCYVGGGINAVRARVKQACNGWKFDRVGSTGGAQDSWVLTGSLSRWIFIDCYCSENQATEENSANLNITTGSITTGTNLLTVASATNYGIGRQVTVAGAGSSGRDFVANVTNVAGLVLTLDANASTTVTNAEATNAKRDTIVLDSFNGSAAPGGFLFLNNEFGRGAGSFIRYSVNNISGGGHHFFNHNTLNSPIYDSELASTYYGLLDTSQIRVRSTIKGAAIVPVIGNMSSAAGVSNRLPFVGLASPRGNDIIETLIDSLGTTGGTFGEWAVYRRDSGQAKLFSVPGTTGHAVHNVGSPVLIPATPAQITSNQNDYQPASVPTKGYWRLTSDAARSITGIAGGTDGRVLKIVNAGAFNITLQNQNAGSAAENRIITGTGADVVLAPDDTAELLYDGSAAGPTLRWRITNVH